MHLGRRLTMFVLSLVGMQAAHYDTFLVNGYTVQPAAAINDSGVMVGSCGAGNVVVGFVRAADGTITTFKMPDQGPLDFTVPQAINNRGVITGSYVRQDHVSHGFVRYGDGHFARFDVSGATSTMPAGINESGAIIGTYRDATGVPHAFVRASDGTITTFDAPGAGSKDNQGTWATGINASGVVAGYYWDASQTPHGFLRATDGTMSIISVPGAKYGTFVFAVNASGVVAGTYVIKGLAGSSLARAFVRAADGTISTFSAPNASPYQIGTKAYALNDRGDVAGFYYSYSYTAHGFVRHADGTIKEFTAPGAGISTPQTYEGTFLSAGALNARGDVAGTLVNNGEQQLGFVRTH